MPDAGNTRDPEGRKFGCAEDGSTDGIAVGGHRGGDWAPCRIALGRVLGTQLLRVALRFLDVTLHAHSLGFSVPVLEATLVMR